MNGRQTGPHAEKSKSQFKVNNGQADKMAAFRRRLTWELSPISLSMEKGVQSNKPPQQKRRSPNKQKKETINSVGIIGPVSRGGS